MKAMENFARVVFTIIFITILAGIIVAFGLFAVAPAEKVVKVISGNVPSPTSTDDGVSLSDLIKEIIVSQVPPGNQEAREVISPPAVPDTNPTSERSAPAPANGPVITGNYRPNPFVSLPIPESDAPEGFLVLEVGTEGYNPRVFEVRANSQVNLAIVSRDSESHLFVFRHAALADVGVGIGPGQMRTLTFTAPPTAGEYTFQCGVPGHAARGETGTMVVR